DSDERQRFEQGGRRTAEGFRLEIWQRRWSELIGDMGWIDRSRLATYTKPRHERHDAGPPKKASITATAVGGYDGICFSIIAWVFGWQRPQQIMSRFANQGHRVFFLSTSRFVSADDEQLKIVNLRENVWELQLRLP